MVKFLIAIACLFTSLLASTESARTTLALTDLKGQGGIDSSTASFMSDRLRNELFNTGAFTVVERDQMSEILKEQGFWQSGACSNDACVVEVGQLLGVKQMLAGSIGKVGSTYSISVRLIDVATGRIVQTANSDCKCEVDDVLSHSPALEKKEIRKYFKNFREHMPVMTTVNETTHF